jgi:acetyltransferase-like isoleucine patch superfamily enzyme
MEPRIEAVGEHIMGAFRKLRTRLGLRKPRLNDCWPWPGIHVGRYTYGVTPKSIHGYDETVDFSIGAFCSIAEEVRFFCRSDHPVHMVSTFPLEVNVWKTKPTSSDLVSKGPIRIGNDVWVGYGASIMSGVTIGDGAVVGARSVVTRNVDPYQIVAGVPAKPIGCRFSSEIVAGLLSIRWWEWKDETIRERMDLMMDSPENLFEFCRSSGEMI